MATCAATFSKHVAPVPTLRGEAACPHPDGTVLPSRAQAPLRKRDLHGVSSKSAHPYAAR
eukprot:CAMPEP_0115399304 /NCGR_PEP_ID=MMETSP0271-20121206/14770_1 /TAXON_ID=71861 /ORGANISM="Scrippsiella trochoidea, Strain CCMP3099" /LENGTH=59 /DNA_ID=CAMNT_0002823117 /DNA_START=234 /DNA_END=409 /DNA_ORIENTATION=-